MAKIDITTAKNVIESNPRKAYFKIKNTGGPRGATGAQGPQGIPGSDGAQGVPGRAATITVGSTTTLPAGSNATVTNSGNQYDAVLEFGIPTGPQGPTGATGARGPRGFQGEKGAKGDTGAAATITLGSVSTGAAGSNASIVNTGDDHNAVYNFTIPRGAKGDTGTSPTVAVYGTTTLPAGSQATVTNVGTSQDVQLQFGIPQGEAGKNTKLYSSTGQNTDGAMTQKATTDALAPKIQTEVVAELPATGDEGKLYLTPKDYTTGTASGNPITITLGEDAGQVTSFQLDGDTFQQTYTGKNIFTTGNFDYTNGGIHSIGSNGVINSSGNLSQAWGFNIYGGKNLIPSGIIPAGTYTVSITKAVVFPLILGLVAEDTTVIGNYTIPAGGTSYAFTTDRPAKYFTLWSNYADHSGEQISVTGLSIMIESGSSVSSFEPYVGGIPSPSPDYPQAVQTVTGEQTVEIVGKNLFSGIFRQGNQLNTIASKRVFSQGDGIYLKTGDTITLSTDLDTTTKDYAIYLASIPYPVNDSQYIIYNSGYKQTSSFTYTATADGYLGFTVRNRDETSIAPSDLGGVHFQVELGSSATAYTPYSKQTLPLNLGKNLLSMTDETTTSGSAVSTVSSNNHFEVSGSVSESWGFQLVPSRKQITPIQPGTYTLSITNPLPFATRVQFRNTSSGSSLVGNLDIPSGTTSITFTLNETANYITWWSTASVGTTVTASFDAMIEAGSQATTYAPYKTPIELCKLGDYQDYIYKDGDSWKVHKATKSVTLTGSENWQYRTAGTTADFYQINNANWNDYFGANTNAIGTGSTEVQPIGAFAADKLTSIDANDVNMKTYEGIGKKGQWFRISLLTSRGVTTVDDFKTWLASNNIKTYYALATATDTTITDTNLIAQLEAIRTASLQASNTITNTATGSNLAGDMELGYYEYNPTNRYDKWLWLDLNDNYEKLGS